MTTALVVFPGVPEIVVVAIVAALLSVLLVPLPLLETVLFVVSGVFVLVLTLSIFVLAFVLAPPEDIAAGEWPAPACCWPERSAAGGEWT